MTAIEVEQAQQVSRARGWRWLLVTAGIVEAALLAAAGAVLGDLEALAMAVVLALSLGLLRVGRGTIGTVVLALLSTNTLGWMALGAVSNLLAGQGLVELALPAALTTSSAAALVAAVGHLVTRDRPSGGTGRGPRLVGLSAVALFLVAMVVGVLSPEPEVVEGDAVTVVSENAAFSTDSLSVPAGTVTVALENRDLFWHTFTIDELGIDIAAPVGAARTGSFEAAPGTYRFYCRIPGHTQAGMVGTLTVEGPG